MFEAEIKYLADGPVCPGGPPLSETCYHDVYFDRPDGSFYASGRELRLRLCDGVTTLTGKLPPFDAATGSKEERETRVADGAALRALLVALGFVPRIAYTKRCRLFRDVFRERSLAIAIVTVDFSPETFVEIEHLAATRAAGLDALPVIRAYAAGLGLRRECRRTYTDLFLDWRAAHAPHQENAPSA